MSESNQSSFIGDLIMCNNCSRILPYNDYLIHLDPCNNINLKHRKTMDNNINLNVVNDREYDREYDGDIESNNEDDDQPTNQLINQSSNLSHLSHLTNNTFIDMAVNMGIKDYNMLNLIDRFSSVGFGLKDINSFGMKITLTSNTECTICLETYNIGNEFYYMKCGHIFCLNCTEKWFKLNSKCPICNYDFLHL
jgi:hypothetical protein